MALDPAHKPALIAELCRYVRIPSRSYAEGGEERALQALVARQMRDTGATVRVFEPGDVPGFLTHPLCCGPQRDYAGRTTVVGELGPADAPALLILAHSDTVPIHRPEEWTFDPFAGRVEDGRVLGRGAGDDKWGIAVMLTVMRVLSERGQALAKRLIFASTVDEEHGVGNGTLLLALAGIRAESALYLDGYQMKVLLGNMGGSNLYLRPVRPEEHTALAADEARLTAACQAFSAERSDLYERPFFSGNTTRDSSVILHRRRDERGGAFLVACYTLPGEQRNTFSQNLEHRISDALGGRWSRYERTWREPWFEPSLVSPDTPMVGMVTEAITEVTGNRPEITTISKQDCFVLNNHAEIPTVSFGPRMQITGRGANHEPDECISVAEVWDGCNVAWGAICRWLAD